MCSELKCGMTLSSKRIQRVRNIILVAMQNDEDFLFFLVVCFMWSLTLARSSTMCFGMTSEEFGVLKEYFGGSSLQSGDCHPFWLIFCSFLAGCDQVSGDAYYFGNRGSSRTQKGITLHLSNIWKRDMEFHFVKILMMVLSADRSILLVT